ncbi:MAG TPA: adenine nucleotide alpha hydrolase family protein [archaeon]|nr:adenine nucleotide alpha hydrolase family protein [archaeon]
MAKKCRFCKGPLVYPEERLCAVHLAKYVEKRVDKVLEKVMGLKEKKLLVAVSGGKDSMGLAHLLSRKGLNLELLHIDLGIPCSSAPALTVVKAFAEARKLKLNVITLADWGFTVENLNNCQSLFKSNTCSLCGSVKRYLFNRFAHEQGFDFVVTAHNQDDIAAFAVMGISAGDLRYTSKLEPISWPESERKTVGRIRPYFYVPEKVSLLYTLTQELPYHDGKCPYLTGNKQGDIKSALLQMETTSPGFRQHLVKFVRKVPVSDSHLQVSSGQPNSCRVCGYPTAIDICRFCRICEGLSNQSQHQ